MCDCEVRNHPGSRCGSVNCQCHIEENAIVNDHLSATRDGYIRSKKYYLMITIDDVTETQGAAMIDAVCNINETLAGVSVSWSAPLGEDS